MSKIAKASQHAWIYAVLIEMNDYCNNEGLDGVAESLGEAIERMEPIIFPSLAAQAAPSEPRRVASGGVAAPVASNAASILPFKAAR